MVEQGQLYGPDSRKTIHGVLFGAAYYHEYQPYERLEEDVALMQAASVSVVRLGESTWSHWEPEDGRIETKWMGRRYRCRACGWHQGHPRYADLRYPALVVAEAPRDHG